MQGKPKEEDDPTVDGHQKTVSNLAIGINRIAVNHPEEKQQRNALFPEGQMDTDRVFPAEGERKAEGGGGNSARSVMNHSFGEGSAAACGRALAASEYGAAHHGHGGSGSGGERARRGQSCELSEEECDRSQSSVSGQSLDDGGGRRGRRSSFLSLSRAGKAYSPRWMDQGHRRMASSDGCGSLTDDNAVASFSMIKPKASPPSNECMLEAQHNDSASQASQPDTAHDDEGYLSHSTAEGYQSGGYHSYHPAHPALSYAPSVKSDIATGKMEAQLSNAYFNAWVLIDIFRAVCSGSVVEDIDMAEMASVASEPTSKAATSSLERCNTRESTASSNPKGVEFASNILMQQNDMGPPALCSALLLAANAACRPSSRSSLRSFDTDNDGDAPSDVIAHVDTDDCYEACSLHSQEDTPSIHKDLDESETNPSSTVNGHAGHEGMLSLCATFRLAFLALSHVNYCATKGSLTMIRLRGFAATNWKSIQQTMAICWA